jgi:hypothetical protein
MKAVSKIIAIACVLLVASVSGRALAEPPPTPAAPSVPDLGFHGLTEADLPTAIAKSNGVVGLLNASLRGKQSIDRYAQWANLKTGPTGKERIIYGLYSVGSSAKDAVDKARKAADAQPAIPVLDDATRQLATAFETLIPILNEAEAYYDRKDYLSDNMAGGKALHERLMPAATTFLAARNLTEALQNQFKDLIDRQQLAAIEKAEGKSVRWHLRNTMMLASKTVDLMPRSPKRGADLAAFDAALAAYGDAVRDFDTAVRDSGKSTPVDSYPRDILGKLREMRDDIARGHVDPMSFSMNADGIINSYNMMVTMSNAFLH